MRAHNTPQEVLCEVQELSFNNHCLAESKQSPEAQKNSYRQQLGLFIRVKLSSKEQVKMIDQYRPSL